MRYDLPAHLDTTAAAELRSNLLALINDDIEINAQNVEYCGTLCLQVILSARLEWAKNSKKFKLDDPSSEFLTAVRTLGFSSKQIGFSEEVNSNVY